MHFFCLFHAFLSKTFAKTTITTKNAIEKINFGPLNERKIILSYNKSNIMTTHKIHRKNITKEHLKLLNVFIIVTN